jgi:hypothetical protein
MILLFLEEQYGNFAHKIITPKFIGRTKYAKLILIIVFVLMGSFTGITETRNKNVN